MVLGQDEWDAHAKLVGQVTLAWNYNIHQLLRIFCHLTGLGSPLAEAIFFSHKSDRGQRTLIRETAEAVGLAHEHCMSLAKLLKQLDDIAPNRNLAAHTIFGLSMVDPTTGAWSPTVVPALSPPQDSRLEPDFRAQFRMTHRKLRQIYYKLEDWLMNTPFPERAWGSPQFVGPIPGYANGHGSPPNDQE